MLEDKAKKFKELLKDMPTKPGIYKMLDSENIVIYVGKAKNLKNRVKNYFQKNYFHSSRTKILLEKVENIEYIAVDSELEAIILERNLLKQLKPKYNVIMKDDKSFVYIKITKEDFPRIELVRNIQKDGSKYIGPKTSSKKIKESLKILKKLFPYRHCALNIELIKENKTLPNVVEISNKVIKYPCLDYHIKKCAAPCIGNVSKEDYNSIIKNISLFLEGKNEMLIKELKEKMFYLAEKKQFEKAASIRDKLKQLENIGEKQKITTIERKDSDIINYLITDKKAYFNLFQIRNGTLTGQENFIYEAKLEENFESSSEVLETFIKDYYTKATDIPKEIVIPHTTEDIETTTKYLKSELNHSLKFIVPQIGEKEKLLKMSLNNAKIFADRHKPSWQEESPENNDAVKELSKILKLNNIAKRIECFDISHFGGTNTVASMVVFENGVPKKSYYRKFKLKTLEGKIDDFKSMEEVLKRRLLYLTNEKILITKIKNKNKYKISLKTEKYEIEFEKNKKNLIILNDLQKNLPLKTIFTKISKKEKISKIYINCLKKDKEDYLSQGFEELKNQDDKEIDQYTKLTFITNKHKLDESFLERPNLIIIDGGKGQLSSASKSKNSLQLDIPMIGLAKKNEEIFTEKNSTPIILNKKSLSLKLLQRIRDEAHRFAITFQKQSRTF